MKRLPSRVVTVADQVVSSGSNFLLVGVVAHVSTPARFGEFTLGYVLLIFLLGLERALVGEVMLVRFAQDRRVSDFRGATGLAVLVGLVGALLLLVGAVVTPGSSALWLLLAAAAPIVLGQDVLRYVMICCRAAGLALLLDIVWLVLSGLAMLGLALADASTLQVLAAWIGGGLVSGVLGLALVRTRPRLLEGVRWFKFNRDLSVRFAAEFASLNGSTALVWFVLAAPLGAAGIAALRGASLLFSPLNTAFNSVRIAMIPELVRSRGTAAYRRNLVWVAATLLAGCLVWGGAVLLAPTSLGEVVLGQTWVAASELRLPNFAQALAMVAYTLLLAYFRSSSSHAQSSQMRAVLALLTLVLPVALAWLAGPLGTAWGFAAAVAGAATVGLVLSRATWVSAAPRALEDPA